MKVNYIICVIITVAVMAAALFLPSLRLPVQQTIDQPEEADNSLNTEAETDTNQLSYLERIKAVGAKNSDKRYKREIITDNSSVDELTAGAQFMIIIQLLYENEILGDESVYEDILSDDYTQSVSDFSYTKDSEYLLTLRVVERVYSNTTTCSKISASIGLDKDTGEVYYVYLNYYGIEETFDDQSFYDEIMYQFADNWPKVLGYSNYTFEISNELFDVHNARYLSVYTLPDDNSMAYKFGFSYDSQEDRFQIFITPC